jgi:Reverse transcriptase (RNA-dependent DNA polymerase)
MVQNKDGTMRGVADLSHLSDRYGSIATKAEALEGFSASLMPGDRMLSMDLRSGYNHFRLHSDMRKYFTVRIVMADDTERYFQYLMLPFGWSRSGYWFSRLVQRFWTMVKWTLGYRVLSYVDDYAIAPSLGSPASLADCRRAWRRLDALLLRYGLTRQPSKGVWGDGSQCLQPLVFVVDTVRGLLAIPTKKLDAISSFSRQLLTRARHNRRLVRADSLEKFYRQSSEYAMAVPDTAFHLRALYDCVPARATASMPLTFLGKRCRTSTRTARLSHPALNDLGFWSDLANQLQHRPILPEVSKPTVTILTDASMTAYGATLALGEKAAGAKGFNECRGYWEGSHLNKAHTTLLELATVRLCLKDVLQHCVLLRDAVIKLCTDNMVTLFVVNEWVSNSSVIMAELGRLHQLCKRHGLELELHHRPSALNLYADRLSRRLRVVDYCIPSLDGVPEHWWVGDSEHDIKLDWSKVDLLRPPLEMLPLDPRKAHQDSFKGLMLVPCWSRQNWYQDLMAMRHSSCDLTPNLPAKGKHWRATLISFSLAVVRNTQAYP